MIIPNIWENKKCSKPPTRFTMEKAPLLVGQDFHPWAPATLIDLDLRYSSENGVQPTKG